MNHGKIWLLFGNRNAKLMGKIQSEEAIRDKERYIPIENFAFYTALTTETQIFQHND
jgi:hypothetical protein